MRAITWAKILELRLRQDVQLNGVEVDEIASVTEGLIGELCWNESRLLEFLELRQGEEEWSDEDMRHVVRVMTQDGYAEGDWIMDELREWIMDRAMEIIQDRRHFTSEGGEKDVEF